jgi:hypothetical protein
MKDEDEEKRIKDLDKNIPVEYTEIHMPVIINSIFINSMAYDVSYLFM